MIAYKYVTPDRIDVIENGCIRFTQAAALNDPFEIYPCFSLFNESLKERSRSLLKREEGRFNARAVVMGEIMLPKMVREHTIKFQRDLGNSYPMLSLTKKRNNLLMWSHYANAHRGFVIGFDSDNPFFHREKPRRMTPLSEVKYSSRRFVLPRFEESMIGDVHEQILLTKSEHWSYEEELRMFAQPKAADVVLKGNDGMKIYLFKFPSECLREIIFGHIMQQPLKQKISDIAERLYPNVELFKTRLNETNFDLDVIPYRR
jgi:hypothetical protein